jgi:hypothetical protein
MKRMLWILRTDKYTRCFAFHGVPLKVLYGHLVQIIGPRRLMGGVVFEELLKIYENTADVV